MSPTGAVTNVALMCAASSIYALGVAFDTGRCLVRGIVRNEDAALAKAGAAVLLIVVPVLAGALTPIAGFRVVVSTWWK